jgi:protoheme IX farnesyltransferase
VADDAAAPAGGQAGDYVTLAKPRLNMLVVATTLAGYYMAAPRGLGWALLLHTLAGTALVASGASAFNQLLEIESDGLMRRTRARPLPSGRIAPGRAKAFAIVLSIAGLAQLALAVNLLAAGVALATLLTYTVFYTPLKKRTSLATVVGGVPGALPPMIGWAAVRDNLSLEAWILFGIVFLWQMPHFLAIAWMYREDYKRAGFPLLPIVEPDGGSTGRQAVIYAAALLPVSLAPAAAGLTGNVYLAGAALMGLGFLALAARFARFRAAADARRLFFGSIVYLPLLWILMVVNRVTR